MTLATANPFPGQGRPTPDLLDLVADTRPERLAMAVGPGRVLTALAQRTVSDVELVSA